MRSIEYNIVCDGDLCPDTITSEPQRNFQDAFSDAQSKAIRFGWTLNYGDGLNESKDYCPDCKPK